MEAPDLKRKLVAIMAGDFEGFSRHMERDEAGTLAVLSSHRRIIDAAISEYGGRITGTAGDSVLAEFESVVSAINCAVQIQQVLGEENASLDEERRLSLRIGINVGDVMVKDGDILGTASIPRLDWRRWRSRAAFACRGACAIICAEHRIVGFDDLGEQKVKNIAQPVRAFKVRFREGPGEEADDSKAAPDDMVEAGLMASPSPLDENVEDVELTFWNSIKDSENSLEFDAYLERYPDGAFTLLARTRRDNLLAAAAERAGSARADPEDLAVELAFWEAAKESNKRAELEAYLQRYPEGEFVTLAEARLRSLEGSAVEAVAGEEAGEVELTFWNSIKDSDDPEMFRAYLKRYPEGAFADLARIKLERGAAPVR